MEDTRLKLARLIHDPAHLTEQFIEEWCAPSPYVKAHTSGSTGTPKEIKLLKSDMVKSAEATCRFFGLGPGSRMLLPLSSSYIAGKMMIVRSLVSGASLWVEKASMSPVTADYGRLDLVPVVPAQLKTLLANPRASQIINLLIGGAPLSRDEESSIQASGIHAWASYGMTETCSHVALRDISSGCSRFTTLPGITCSADARGCLVIDAPGFSFGRIVTNDVADIHDTRRFTWKGRHDNVIISGGVKLYPELIEHSLGSVIHSPFYIIGRPSEKWGEEAVLYIEDTGLDTRSLHESLKKILPRYSVPKEIIAVAEFQRTPTGKVQRMLL